MNDCCASKRDNGKAYDLAVIGAGSLGFSAAITAAGAVWLTAWRARTVGLIGFGLYRRQRRER